MNSPPHYSMRERAAIRLYAAFLDASADDLPSLFKSRISDKSLEAWLRVLDVAGGVKDLREGPVRPDMFPRHAPKKVSTHPPKLVLSPKEEAPKPGAKTWCEQCDRGVMMSEAKACTSKFCKVKGLAW